MALAVAEAHDQHPDCEAIAICNHGLFTFGADARQSYEKMVEVVDRAERFVDGEIGGGTTMLTATAEVSEAGMSEAEVDDRWAAMLPTLRGAVATESESALGPRHWRLVAERR